MKNEPAGAVRFQWLGQQLVLDPAKALFWVDQEMLVVADLHLGKAAHFRKHGVPVSAKVHHSDLQRLTDALHRYCPQTIVFLGDLFHSEQNAEWDDFISWSNANPQIAQILVRGNHDVLHEEAYAPTLLQLKAEWETGPFHFTHEPQETVGYNLAGHIHPGVRLHGVARQHMTLPCFCFSRKGGLLPAFGNFTGCYQIRPRKGDHIFPVASSSVVSLVGEMA